MNRSTSQRGIALLAVLVVLTLLMVLALPFTVGMGAGLEASSQSVDEREAEMAVESARDLLLSQAALGHGPLDETPHADGLAEFPGDLALPKGFDELRGDGRVLFSGEVWDLQRFIDVEALTPLTVANLLGTTARLAEDLAPEARVMLLDNAGNLPESGYVWMDHEVIRYGARDGNQLLELQRYQLADRGFATAPEKDENTVVAGVLVLDFRAVLAVAWPWYGRGGPMRTERRPWGSVAEIAEIGTAGQGGFTAVESDRLAASLTAGAGRMIAPVWGRPERVFQDVPANGRTLYVKGASHIGPGSTVRLRNVQTGAVEYGLVMSSTRPRGGQQLQIPDPYELHLLCAVLRDFPALDTVVEPLVPPPLNLNTASAETLTALMGGLRASPSQLRTTDPDGKNRRAPPPAISASEASGAASRIVDARSSGADFAAWQDLVDRVFQPILAEQTGNEQRVRWWLLYSALQQGRMCGIEMGTVPLAFSSSPWVGYRAAASVGRSAVAPQVAARRELSGIAIALPGLPMEHEWRRQDALEEAFRLDARARGWLTLPVNTGAGDNTRDPALRSVAHLAALAFPAAGLGQARFPSTDEADGGFTATPATAPMRPTVQRAPLGFDPMQTSIDPRGHDVSREGAYRVVNSGPSARGGQGGRGGAEPPSPEPGSSQSSGRSQVRYPFSVDGGGAGRFGIQFWAEPESLSQGVLMEYGDGTRDRNRIAVEVRDNALRFEVVDEAGIDPNPAASVTSPDRTAMEWNLPLTDLGLPARTPVHLNVAAYGNRAGELSMLVDGFRRGKPKFLTHLAAPIPVYDPSQQGTVQPGQGEKFLDITVEDASGFPQQGVLRVGTELFEYTAINGNSFRCQWNDSRGGRIARQAPREFRPDIPVDQNGRPTVDPNNLPAGVNLDVAPEHPVGAAVELYGYSAPLSPDTAVQVGATQLEGSIGAFAVARGWLSNPRPVIVSGPTPPGQTFQLGTGINMNEQVEIELADPIATRNYPPAEAIADVANAFPATGGYALLVQRSQSFSFQSGPGQQTGTATVVGGIEVVQFTARRGNRLTGVRRAATLPGNDADIQRGIYNGQSRNFITNWNPSLTFNPGGAGQGIPLNEVNSFVLFVVPISLPVTDTGALIDPSAAGLSEWLQLCPEGNEVDTEWVRYDQLVDRRHVVRAYRGAWNAVYSTLTGPLNTTDAFLNPLGGQVGGIDITFPTVQATSGFIGYVSEFEARWPIVNFARNALAFRGDPFTGTSSHAHAGSPVLPVHRLSLWWGNFGAFTGRPGRQDRVALVAGSQASGTTRPAVEWHTVNWSVRRYGIDSTNQQGQPTGELLGPQPFQLVAFKQGVANLFVGPPASDGNQLDVRWVDRIVKFPSGELPAAYAANVTVGGPVAGGDGMSGFIDELGVVGQNGADLVLEDPVDAQAREFRVEPGLTLLSGGPAGLGNGILNGFPTAGGLVQIDDEILAYQVRADAVFTVAVNGRGLLNSEARGHDKGARVRFLAHVPAAILSGSIQPQSETLSVQSIGGLPVPTGTLLAGRELLHYAWVRTAGDTATLEMPRFYPPDGSNDGRSARGLFRGRYGTAPQGLSSGEALVWMPIRYWDRHVPRSDDPEQNALQLTSSIAPVFWKSLTWRQEVPDASVDLECLARFDQRVPFTADPAANPDLRLLSRGAGNDRPFMLGRQATQLELRFVANYRPGCIDLTTFRAHGWKTTPTVREVRVEYESEGRILEERVTAR